MNRPLSEADTAGVVRAPCAAASTHPHAVSRAGMVIIVRDRLTTV